VTDYSSSSLNPNININNIYFKKIRFILCFGVEERYKLSIYAVHVMSSWVLGYG
jgi:hypothetical protein